MIEINFHLNNAQVDKILEANGYEIEIVHTKDNTTFTHGSDKDYLKTEYAARMAYKKGERPEWLNQPILQGLDYRYEADHVAKGIIIDKLMGLFCS